MSTSPHSKEKDPHQTRKPLTLASALSLYRENSLNFDKDCKYGVSTLVSTGVYMAALITRYLQ